MAAEPQRLKFALFLVVAMSTTNIKQFVRQIDIIFQWFEGLFLFVQSRYFIQMVAQEKNWKVRNKMVCLLRSMNIPSNFNGNLSNRF